MSGSPWYKHYPRDFLEGVQGMGPDAIGAYIVVLDLIYARGGSVPADWRYLAGVMGCSTRLAKALVDRLIGAGKLSIAAGQLTNIRAENEIETHANRTRMLSEAGANGGRKRAEKQAAANENSNLATRRLKAGSSNIDTDTDTDKKQTKSAAAGAAEFEIFWQAYPRREGKQHAAKAWAKSVQAVTPAKIIAAARRYAEAKADTDKRFIKQPATWLNGGCWDDDFVQPTHAGVMAGGTGDAERARILGMV